MVIYTRKFYTKNLRVKCKSVKDAFKKAIEDWESGQYLPQHIKDESGKYLVRHADLRKKLSEVSNVKSFRGDWV